jgi:hypothetical protein
MEQMDWDETGEGKLQIYYVLFQLSVLCCSERNMNQESTENVKDSKSNFLNTIAETYPTSFKQPLQPAI